MTNIDFRTGIPDKVDYACRLLRKAYASGARVVVLTADGRQQAQLDEALWVQQEQEFIPHVEAGSPQAAQTPIILTARDDVELPHHEVLVNLSDATPGFFARFERMIELVSTDEADAAAGRERYAFYKKRGYPLDHTPVKNA